ncbi:AAA family ATPase [Tardiphaga sp. 71_E8_N1_1]|uniref:AAA family ATPase n=1 Tax=Tardiphaga sp. 71_E8_N1_1 TaxID=3240784 RepID=UPI003F8B1400
MSDSSTKLVEPPYNPAAPAPPAPMLSKLDAAVAFGSRGFKTFPARIGEKKPLIEGWQTRASSDEAEIRKVWEYQPELNIAGFLPSGFILDYDANNGKQGRASHDLMEAIYEKFPRTYTQNSPRGGFHKAFGCAPEIAALLKTCENQIDGFPHVDVRAGSSGYVIGAGSTTPDGVYTVADNSPIAEAPQWLLDILPKNDRRSAIKYEAPLDGQDSEAEISRATYYLEHSAEEAIEGQGGDNATIRVINDVRDFNVSAEKTTDLLLEKWNYVKAHPPWDPYELAKKVASASKSRQNAVGVKSAEVEFDAVEINDTPPPASARKGLFGTDWHEDGDLAEDPYLIDGIISCGSMVVTYGDSNVGKTFVKLDQCFHIAAGKDWNGHKVKQGLVVYVAAEGGKGFLKRIAAYKAHYGAKRLPFTTVPCPIDLQSDQADTAKLVKLIREAELRHGAKCVLIVIDTLARAMSGGDENTAVDMSKFVGHSDRLRAATGATVDVIHHTGKDKSKGARGSSALRAATDTEIEVDTGVVRVTKQRDMDTVQPMPFELLPVEIGHRADGAAITSCVVNWTTSAAGEFLATLTPPQQLALDALDQAISTATKSGEPKRPVAHGEWVKAMEVVSGSNTGAKGKVNRASPVLIQAGYVVKTAGNQYVRIGHE